MGQQRSPDHEITQLNKDLVGTTSICISICKLSWPLDLFMSCGQDLHKVSRTTIIKKKSCHLEAVWMNVFFLLNFFSQHVNFLIVLFYTEQATKVIYEKTSLPPRRYLNENPMVAKWRLLASFRSKIINPSAATPFPWSTWDKVSTKRVFRLQQCYR